MRLSLSAADKSCQNGSFQKRRVNSQKLAILADFW